MKTNIKKALIIGISGQDGSYLAKLLVEMGYEVHGTSRDAELSSFYIMKQLGIFDKVKLHSMSLIDFRSVTQTIMLVEPDEIYNLAGQTSVGLSFLQPVETLESISLGTLNILEVIRFHRLPIKLYNACSSECFGDTEGMAADERTHFKPKSPYAVAKSTAFWLVSNYREAYKIYACSGILFNHESPFRPIRFVTKKIINTVCNIALGKETKMVLGNLKVKRDWGWAPEYVKAMHLMLQLNEPSDFVIATGRNITLEEFVKLSFNFCGLDYKKYLEINDDLIRPSDIAQSLGNPEKAKIILGWEAKYFVEDVVKMMVENEMKFLKS